MASADPEFFFSHAVVYADGVTHDLNDLVDQVPAVQLFYAYDINNRGEIVGFGKVNGNFSGILLTPSGHSKENH